MKRGSAIIIMSVLCLGLFCGAAQGAGEKKASLLFDGYALGGVEGTLVSAADGGKRLFKLEEDVTDGKAEVKAGAELELLPSSGLERLLADANDGKDRSYRLWGRVTKYRERNFIFSMYYLPLDGPAEIKQAEPKAKGAEQAAAPAEDANDVVSLPVEVMEKLRSRKVVRTEQLTMPLDIKQDSILADRTGFLSKAADGLAVFTLDSFGRNVPRVSFELLPCEAMERAQDEQASGAEEMRLKAAGVVTRYKGKYYLLLQRANRVYGHGNFAR